MGKIATAIVLIAFSFAFSVVCGCVLDAKETGLHFIMFIWSGIAAVVCAVVAVLLVKQYFDGMNADRHAS